MATHRVVESANASHWPSYEVKTEGGSPVPAWFILCDGNPCHAHEVDYSECVCHRYSLQEVAQQPKVYRKCTRRVGSDENVTTDPLVNLEQAHERS